MVNNLVHLLCIRPRPALYHHLGVPLGDTGNIDRFLCSTLGEIYNWSLIFALGVRFLSVGMWNKAFFFCDLTYKKLQSVQYAAD
jgi:hypothetical protein